MSCPSIRTLAATLAALACVSCAAGSMFQLTPEEQAGLDRAMGETLTFTVPRDQAIVSWDRAHEFVDRYSTMKLRNFTDSLLVTYDTPTYQSVPTPDPGSGIRFGYSIRRASGAEGIQVQVECTASSKLGENDASKNAHLAALYVRTGQLGCERCIVR